MKHILSALLFIVAATSLSAQSSYSYLTLRTTDGNERSLPLAGGLTITFGEGNLIATIPEETTVIPLSQMDNMVFDVTPTAISALQQAATSARYSGRQLTVNAPAGSRVSVYATDGRLVGTFVKGNSGSETLLSALPAGTYLVSINGKTTKLLAR